MSFSRLIAPAVASLVALSACSEAPSADVGSAPTPSSNEAQTPSPAPSQVAEAAPPSMTMAMTITPPAPAADTAHRQHGVFKAANFKLTDQYGKAHELHAMTDAKAIVVAMQGVGCPIVRKMTPDIKDLYAAYKDRGVAFYMINANIQDTPDMIRDEAEMFEISMPILKDTDQKTASQLKAVRTAEYYIIEPKTWNVLYHGPINDRLTYGREKAKPDQRYVGDRLDMILAGQSVEPMQMEADGCIINYVQS
jgi:peroxiredoxin